MRKLIIAILLCIALCVPCEAADSTRTAFASTSITSRFITIPVGTIIKWPQNAALPGDADPKWRECDGRAVPTDSDLYKQKGMGTTPNLYAGNGYFTRAGATPRQIFGDKTRSHNHGQPSHTHTWSGQLASTAISGTAKGQEYYDLHSTMNAKGYPTGYNPWPGNSEAAKPSLANIIVPYTTPDGGHSHSYTYEKWVSRPTESNPHGGYWKTVHSSTSSVSDHNHRVNGTDVYWTPWVNTRNAKDSEITNAKVVDGTVIGTNAEAGGDPTYFTSMRGGVRTSTTTEAANTETAPMYYTTRYFIRIND